MMKVLSLFSGIGAFEAALDNIGIDFELVGYCEIDKYASKSYSAIHGVPESMNYGDITKIDEKSLPKDIDLITYGFPCQDISLAGKQKGLFNEDGSQTRSGLFFEALRIIEETQPKIAIAENVKNLTSKKFAEQFEIVLSSLEEAGYNNYWKVLNAKDYGIPQNRERVFIVSIRKDIDTGVFEFPEPYELKLRLKDMLEVEVDEKFYIKSSQFGNLVQEPQGKDIKVVGYMTGNNGRFERHQSNTVYDTDGICPTQYAGQHKDPFRIIEEQSVETEPVIRQVANVHPTKNRANPNQGRVYDPNYIAPSLNTCGGGNLEPHVVVTSAAMRGRYDKDGHIEQTVEVSNKEIANSITTVQKDSMVCEPMALDEQNKYIRKDGCVGTLTTDGSSPKHNNRVIQSDLRIRKLTPKECFRLMGFDDEDFLAAEKVNSNTQLYKQAGNSIVVDLLEELFCMMFDEEGELYV